MKNVAINTLNYTGIVTLSQYIGTKKVQVAKLHNTGGASLFTFLANCLAGDFTIAKANRPAKVKLLIRSGTDSSTYSYSPITRFVSLRTPPEPTFSAGESRVRFSFIIPRDFLDSLNVSSSKDEIIGLGLYAHSVKDVENEASNFMAFCTLDTLNKNALVNSFLVVDWELVISNKPAAADYNE